MHKIDLNSDLGESFGAYKTGTKVSEAEILFQRIDAEAKLREIEEESLLIIPSDTTEKMRSDREYIKTTIIAVKNS